MEEVNQSIHWRAIYKNGETLEQLENTQEILYDNIDKKNLKSFYLLGCFVDVGVDLEKGVLFLNNKETPFDSFSNLKTPYRLIYYIKTSGVLGATKQPHKIYCVGLQTTCNGKNIKLLVELSNNKMVISSR